MLKKRITSILLAAAMCAMTALAACGPSTSPSSSGSSSSTPSTTGGSSSAASSETTAAGSSGSTAPAEQTATQGDKSQWLNLFLPTNPTMLDPALTSDGQGGLLGFVTESLLNVDKDFKLVPGIAESYEVNDDATVFTFKIKPGVKFHDGTDCDAAAIKWNYDRQVGENATPDMPYAETIFGKVTSVEAPDASTVVITLSESDSTLPIYLAMPNGTGIVSPTAWQADPAGFQRKPVGTGPYKFVEWVDDQYVKLEAYPDYHGGEVQNAGVNFKVIKEPSVLTSEYLSGGIDHINNININDIDQIEKAGFTVLKRPNLGYTFISFADYENNPIFKDERVRQAVWHALDRTALVNGLYGGKLEVANSMLPEGMLGGDKEYKTYEYDVEKAKALLADAGYPDGFTFNYITRNEPQYSNMAVAVQMELAKVGITMNIQILQKSDWLTKIFMETPDHDAILFNWGAASNDPSYMAELWVGANGGTGYNTSGYNNPEFDKLIDEARRTGDTEKQAELYAQAAQMVNDDAPVIFLDAQSYFWSTHDNLIDPDGIIGSFASCPWWKIGKVAK